MTPSAAHGQATGQSPPGASGRATLQVVAGVLGFATISIFTQLATGDGTSLIVVLCLRYLIALVPLVMMAGIDAIRAVPRRRVFELTVGGGGLQAAVAWLSLSALAYIPAATLVFLFYTFPVWVTVMAAARRTEPITWHRVIALLLALTGIASTVGLRSASGLRPEGVALALTASVLYAAFLPIMRRLQFGVSPRTATTFVALGAAVIFLAGATLTSAEVTPLSVQSWVWVGALGVLSTALSFTLFLSGLGTLGPMRTAIVSTVEPFFVAILAALVLDQPVTRGILAGGTCIGAAVLLLQMNGDRQRAA